MDWGEIARRAADAGVQPNVEAIHDPATVEPDGRGGSVARAAGMVGIGPTREDALRDLGAKRWAAATLPPLE